MCTCGLDNCTECNPGEPEHVHEWRETEVYCEDCGDHPAVICDECDEVVDLVMEDDPR